MINLKKLEDALTRDLLLAGVQNAFPTDVVGNDGNAVAEFRARYQSYNFLRKVRTNGVSEKHRTEAFEKFQKLQRHCAERNAEPIDYDWVKGARDIISEILPPLQFVEDDLWPTCKFGPGNFNGAHSDAISYSLHYKIGHDQTVTAEAKWLYLDVISKHFPSWAERLSRWGRRLNTVKGNRLAHVEKDVRGCRPIAIEPSANVFLQQGVGSWLKSHMRAIGFVDLFHGQDLNRRLAGDLRNGTIDLSSASDTISIALVRELLPPDWYVLLNTIRSKRWEFRGREGTYTNFSSQGNAFTFPLETLIFKSVVMAATSLSAREVTVYGDDIIIPVESCPRAVVALEQAGFFVNSEKSYWGQHDDCRKYFRESCGADYFCEELVTPVYLRTQLSEPSEVAVIYNRLIEVWPDARRALSFLYLAVTKQCKPLVGPRYFITDEPEKFLAYGDKLKSLSFNSIVSTYSQWFWNEGPFSSHPISNRMWVDVPRKIPKERILGFEEKYAVFLYGGNDDIPRSVNRRSRRVNVTPASPEDTIGLVRWERLPRGAFRVASRSTRTARFRCPTTAAGSRWTCTRKRASPQPRSS